MSRWATVAAAATLVAGVAFLTPPSARAPVTATAEHVGVHGGAQSNAGSSSGSCWVAVKELNLSYHFWDTLLITIYTHYGNLI